MVHSSSKAAKSTRGSAVTARVRSQSSGGQPKRDRSTLKKPSGLLKPGARRAMDESGVFGILRTVLPNIVEQRSYSLGFDIAPKSLSGSTSFLNGRLRGIIAGATGQEESAVAKYIGSQASQLMRPHQSGPDCGLPVDATGRAVGPGAGGTEVHYLTS